MNIRKLITSISQYLVGVLFVFSGLIKANDPKGFAIKLEEYFQIFKLDLPDLSKFFEVLALNAEPMSIALVVFEMVLGVCLILGVFRRFTVWSLLLMILFFTFLTFYSAQFNKVTDCGCFGDAIKLRPWQSFNKDIFLLFFIVILFINWKYIQRPFMSRITGRRLVVGFGVMFLLFTLFNYMYLPVVDFRPYKPGNDIYKLSMVPEGYPTDSFKMSFIYKKLSTDSTEREFTPEEIQKVDTSVLNQYRFVRRNQTLIKAGYKPPIQGFVLSDSSRQTVTDSFWGQTGYRLIFIYANLKDNKISVQPEINSLISNLKKDKKIRLWAFTSSSQPLAQAFAKENNFTLPFFTLDEVPVKTMIRSNPGVMLLKNNVVVQYWSALRIPTKEKLDDYITEAK
ncbi:MAG: DoxX family protein [Bacteroidota bacterium]|nr:DoxX family protein [Bacteroidota bacterium]